MMRRGHTLFEVLAVLAILAIVWSFILPPFSWLQKSFLLFSTARTLAGELKAAQESAQGFHGKEKIVFSKNSGGGWTFQKFLIFPDNSEKPFIVKTLPENINFNSNFASQTIVFTSNGNPQKAGQINLQLAGSNKQRNIVISPIGRIRVTDAI